MQQKLANCNRDTIQKLVEGLAGPEAKKDIATASRLYDANGVAVLKSADFDLPDDVFGFHFMGTDEAEELLAKSTQRCAITAGELPLSNGVVLTQGHPGLFCSRHTCSCTVCPVALAACFTALAGLGVDPLPVYQPVLDTKSQVDAFAMKWRGRLVDESHTLNLLLSRYENDFAGTVVLEGDAFADELVEDLGQLLFTLDKIDEGAVVHTGLTQLSNDADANSDRFMSTNNRNLKPRTLYVIDRLGDLDTINTEHRDVRYALERLGRIVDQRFYLLVGKNDQVEKFCEMNPAFGFTFDQHRMRLSDLPAEKIYENYLQSLDESLRAQADPEFKERFCRFVEFNRDAFPFYGVELSDYLAKHANALGSLALPKSRYQSSSLDEMLDSVVGLEQVKQTVRRLEKLSLYRKQAQARGIELPAANRHMMFMGNPGTGKTTIARIISTMLYKIGITRRNLCVEVSSKDLIGKYVGHTDKQTSEKVREALGGVLFIDEAYSLVPDGKDGHGSFGKEALAELVKAMEDYKDDLIIIFAGYENEMQDFIDVNPGLASRIGYTFHFEDFTPDQLLEIVNKIAGKSGLQKTPEADAAMVELFKFFGKFRNFGNGRFAAEVWSRAIEKHAARVGAVDDEAGVPVADDMVTEQDIPTRVELFDVVEASGMDAATLLEPLVGLEDVKKKVADLERTVAFREEARKHGLALPEQSLHMVFSGNPGTGKTTVARILGKVLFGVGAVAGNQFVEMEAKDLVGSLVGETSDRVDRAIKRASGGVLFIDEAYALMETQQAREALAVLVKAMEDRRGEFVAIFAGYKDEMRAFLDANPGMVSRIGYSFEFEDYGYDDLTEIFVRKCAKTGFTLEDDARAAARDVFKYFHRVEGFGNGRFVDRLFQEALALHAADYDDASIAVLRASDIPSIEHMCKMSATTVYEPSDLAGEEGLVRVASHEVGHALCRLERTGKTDIVSITMEQEGDGALGYVQHEAHGTPLPTAEDLESELVSLMGGMAAEEMCFEAYSAGNSSDLQMATVVAGRYVASYGMSQAGYVQYLPVSVSVGKWPYAELPEEVRAEMRAVLDRAFAKAKALLADNRAVFDGLVERLMAAGTMTGEELVAAWHELRGDPPEPPEPPMETPAPTASEEEGASDAE